ncbi:YtpR family tRNA-binding protein [Chungangia koreensis]|uniref:YtpR family tRNA-binding protein n=1 Tax=Chungangia koreensis TaxID=752657 RepID=A0ABV8X2Y9_9LACT
MNIFYNISGVGDVLLVQLTAERSDKVVSESSGDVTLIRNSENNDLVAINLFNCSKYFAVSDHGQVNLNSDIVEQLNSALKENGVDIVLDVDLSPKFVVGHVLSKESHPNADKLSVCVVDIGDSKLQIVCGAPNVEAGQKVVVAKVGAVMPSGMIIRDAELRGVPSSGMICSAKELNLPDAPQEKGILVLDDIAEAGSPYLF